MQIGKTSTGMNHSLPISERELRRAHFSLLPSAVVQMVEQSTVQHARKCLIKGKLTTSVIETPFFNQKPSAETHNVEKSTVT